MKLTPKDLETLRLMRNAAIQNELSYMDSWTGCTGPEADDVRKNCLKLVDRYRKLAAKLGLDNS